MHGVPDLSPFKDKKILIVDDNEVNLMLNKIFLKNAGIAKENIFTAQDGFEAVEETTRQLFDVIIMDIHMPGMDGIIASKKIKEQGTEKNIPKIIAYTGDYSIHATVQDKTLFDDFMLKPTKMEEFVGKIFDVLSTCSL